MGFFRSRKAHVDDVKKACARVAETAKQVRKACDDSLRGKYEYMKPEQRADLVKEAHLVVQRLRGALEEAREKKAVMEKDQCPGEDLLAAESLLIEANLDASQAEKALAEARNSLLQGMNEIEQFYGPRSKEARHLRRVLAEFQTTA